MKRTLNSLQRQTLRSWQAVIVDDGSGDATAAIVREAAAADPRILFIPQQNAGASAARNRGLREAVGDHVTFLDSDDTIAPDYAERMLARLRRDPGSDGACCGSQRRSDVGRVISRERPTLLAANPRLACLNGVPAPIHALMVDRRRVLAVGGFDEALRAYEDWDLWIRMMLAGIRIVVEPRILVTYWNSSGSITRDSPIMIRDHAITLARSRALADPSGEAEANVAQSLDALLSAILWNGGIAIGSGRDWRGLLDTVPPLAGASAATEGHINALIDGLRIGAGRPLHTVLELWPKLSPALTGYLAEFEKRAGVDGLAYQMGKMLERLVIRSAGVASARPVGRTMVVPFRPASILSDVRIPPECDSVVFKFGRLLLETPSFGNMTSAAVRAALPRLAAQRLLRSSRLRRSKGPQLLLAQLDPHLRPLARRLKHRLRDTPRASQGVEVAAASHRPPAGTADGIIAAEREAAAQAFSRLDRGESAEAAPRAAEPSGGRQSGDAAIWEAFFAQADPWAYDEPYEQIKYDRTLAILPEGSIDRALELGCAEGRFTERLAPRVARLSAVDISQTAIERAAARCARFGNVSYRACNAFAEDLGSDWDLITCCEMLYYLPGREQLAPFAARLRDALRPGGLLVQAHACIVRDDPTRSGFDWPAEFSAEAIAATLDQTPGLRRVRTMRAPLYRIDLYRRQDAPEETLAPAPVEAVPLGSGIAIRVARQVIWNGPVRTREQLAGARAFSIPVLMYHRIADDGPPGLRRYRTDPAEFERQLLFLRRRGFRSVGLDEWRRAQLGGSLAGRPILITFDDAYADFREQAWPLLQRYDFTAHVFVPTDKVGGAADWDRARGEAAPLMGWDDIRQLAAEGVTFGSHLASHSWATCLSSTELLREAVRSRATLEAVLEREVTSVAPPFGATNPRVEGVLRLAGYREGFLIDGGAAAVWNLGLSTPRVEIRGDFDLPSFAAAIGVEVEAASDRDDRPSE